MDDSVVLQETNHVVVWLRPAPVVAKVAVRHRKDEDLYREHALATELAALGAEVAVPFADPTVHAPTGLLVTLWEHLGQRTTAPVGSEELAASIRRLHECLAVTTVPLPSYARDLLLAQVALTDFSRTGTLEENDRSLLLAVFEDGLGRLDDHQVNERRLHGEPHEGNRIVTSAGVQWLDFESSCVGPIEWDLAFVPVEVARCYRGIDGDLLALLRRLNSARVATWCAAAARFPIMREYGEIHLSQLRDKST
ncbi:MAG: aminoglycoside phosphotransferase family protein [Acidimicrobiales bacterium]